MVVRLGFLPSVALALLTTVGTAAAQYYPSATGDQPVSLDSSGAQVPTTETPANIDPYGSPSSAGVPVQNGTPQIMAPAQGYPAPGYPAQASAPAGAQPGYPQGAYSGQQPATYGAPAQASAPAVQPGYPQGAYSGQQPAGMAPPANVQAAYPAQPAPAYPSQAAPAAGYHANEATAGANGSSVAMLPPEDQPEQGPAKELPSNLKRQVVDYVTKEPAGTIIIDTPNTYLYYVLPGGKAERYGIGVGREGFTWAGTEKISAKKEWADWRPPAEMIERQPYLPRFMAGGPGNPLGARTMYLGGTIYRIHGTNQPSTIGKFMSSGCIRMVNEDVENLYDKVKVGTRVVVLPGNPAKTADSSAAAPIAATPVSAPGGVAIR